MRTAGLKTGMAKQQGEDCRRHLLHHPDSVPNHHRVIRELTEPSLEPDVTRGVRTVNIKLRADASEFECNEHSSTRLPRAHCHDPVQNKRCRRLEPNFGRRERCQDFAWNERRQSVESGVRGTPQIPSTPMSKRIDFQPETDRVRVWLVLDHRSWSSGRRFPNWLGHPHPTSPSNGIS